MNQFITFNPMCSSIRGVHSMYRNDYNIVSFIRINSCSRRNVFFFFFFFYVVLMIQPHSFIMFQFMFLYILFIYQKRCTPQSNEATMKYSLMDEASSSILLVWSMLFLGYMVYPGERLSFKK